MKVINHCRNVEINVKLRGPESTKFGKNCKISKNLKNTEILETLRLYSEIRISGSPIKNKDHKIQNTPS
jgi:hypothetical protein